MNTQWMRVTAVLLLGVSLLAAGCERGEESSQSPGAYSQRAPEEPGGGGTADRMSIPPEEREQKQGEEAQKQNPPGQEK